MGIDYLQRQRPYRNERVRRKREAAVKKLRRARKERLKELAELRRKLEKAAETPKAPVLLVEDVLGGKDAGIHDGLE